MSDERRTEPTPQTQPAGRPAPSYGEYAPEGWSWTPEGDEAKAAETTPASAGVSSARPAAAPVPSVPHNLGAGSSTPQAAPPAAPQQPGQADPAPYRAAAPQPGAPVSARPTGKPAPRRGDRIATIFLLFIGAFGALTMAQSMLGLRASMMLIADSLGLSDYSAPSWLGTLGTISAIVFIAIYAVTLIFSIQRMRAGKLTFWVPLAAGVLVTIAMFVITIVVVSASPELISAMSDPDATQRMLDYLTSEATTQ